MAFSHFETLYKDGGNIPVRDQIMVIKEYPRFFSEDEGDDIFLPFFMDELKASIKASVSSKSPSPDGWTMEFYWHFFRFIWARDF